MNDGRSAEGRWTLKEVSEPLADQVERRKLALVEKSEALDEKEQAGWNLG